MSDISELFANSICLDMQSTTSPVFTVLSDTRIELSGPVLCRWFSKIYAFLEQEFDNTFGITFAISSQMTWRVPIWISALWMKGFRAVTNIEQAEIVIGTDRNTLTQAARNGSLVLALPNGALDYQCPIDLPPGVLDANQEVAAFPDVLETLAPGLPADFNLGENVVVADLFQHFPDPVDTTRVAVYESADIFKLTAQIFSLWNQRAHVVLVTNQAREHSDINEKLQLEKIKATLPKL